MVDATSPWEDESFFPSEELYVMSGPTISVHHTPCSVCPQDHLYALSPVSLVTLATGPLSTTPLPGASRILSGGCTGCVVTGAAGTVLVTTGVCVDRGEADRGEGDRGRVLGVDRVAVCSDGRVVRFDDGTALEVQGLGACSTGSGERSFTLTHGAVVRGAEVLVAQLRDGGVELVVGTLEVGGIDDGRHARIKLPGPVLVLAAGRLSDGQVFSVAVHPGNRVSLARGERFVATCTVPGPSSDGSNNGHRYCACVIPTVDLAVVCSDSGYLSLLSAGGSVADSARVAKAVTHCMAHPTLPVFATAHTDGTTYLWLARNGKLEIGKELQGQDKPSTSLWVSGDVVAKGGEDSILRVFRFTNEGKAGRDRATLDRALSEVRSLEASGQLQEAEQACSALLGTISSLDGLVHAERAKLRYARENWEGCLSDCAEAARKGHGAEVEAIKAQASKKPAAAPKKDSSSSSSSSSKGAAMMETALACKEAGNAHFKAGRHSEAVSCYSRGLALFPADSEAAVLHANRCASLLALHSHTAACEAANRALELRALLSGALVVKTLFRRGKALAALGGAHISLAERSLKEALALAAAGSAEASEISQALDRLPPGPHREPREVLVSLLERARASLGIGADDAPLSDKGSAAVNLPAALSALDEAERLISSPVLSPLCMQAPEAAAGVLGLRAMVLVRMGSDGPGRASARAALAIMPGHPAASCALSDSLVLLRRAKDAAECLIFSLARFPSDPKVDARLRAVMKRLMANPDWEIDENAAVSDEGGEQEEEKTQKRALAKDSEWRRQAEELIAKEDGDLLDALQSAKHPLTHAHVASIILKRIKSKTDRGFLQE
jgi:tetratricopeptide (TPR) repeat protein